MNERSSISNAINSNVIIKRGDDMPSEKQRSAARKNIRKAANAAKKQRTIAHLPQSTRTALGKQGAKVAKEKGRKRAA
jgi:hypothetical protein